MLYTQAREQLEAEGKPIPENLNSPVPPKTKDEPTRSKSDYGDHSGHKASIPQKHSERNIPNREERPARRDSHENFTPNRGANRQYHRNESETSDKTPARARPQENERSRDSREHTYHGRDTTQHKFTEKNRESRYSHEEQEAPSGQKKKESKMERLRRQMAEQDGTLEVPDKVRDRGGENAEKSEPRKRKQDLSKKDDGGRDDENEEAGEVGGWAATAESEGLFNEGEGLMALNSAKDKHIHKPVSGAQKQALLREVIPQWMKTPLDISSTPESGARNVGLDPRLVEAMEEGGYASFFPVQSAVISQLLCTRPGGRVEWSGARDVCVCAPTGSGKTLAFCVPIVQTLMTRVVPRLRALIVEPSRDLAAQVYAVMSALCACCDLRVCLAAGQVSYAEEKASMLPHCDILVATPGRLTEHLLHTPHFTAQHLRSLHVLLVCTFVSLALIVNTRRFYINICPHIHTYIHAYIYT